MFVIRCLQGGLDARRGYFSGNHPNRVVSIDLCKEKQQSVKSKISSVHDLLDAFVCVIGVDRLLNDSKTRLFQQAPQDHRGKVGKMNFIGSEGPRNANSRAKLLKGAQAQFLAKNLDS